MGRLQLAQILMISYIATTCVQNFVSSEGYPVLRSTPHLFLSTVSTLNDEFDVYVVQYAEAERVSSQHEIDSLIAASSYAPQPLPIDESEYDYEDIDIRVLLNLYRRGCKHPDKVEVKALNRSIEVNWKEPAYHCHLSSYQLTFQEEGSMSPISANVSQLPFEQTGLKPFTVYTWKLVHNNETIFMNKTITLEDAPSEVRLLTVTSENSTSLTVNWYAPSEPNGNIRKYRVSYRHTNYISCRYANKSNDTSQGEVTTNSASVVLKDLLPYSWYSVEVAAYTVQYGRAAVITGHTALLDILQVRPEPAETPVIAQRRWAQLFWTPPNDCAAIKGSIEGYSVTLMALSPWVNTTLPMPDVQGSANKPFANCENLTPYTEYRASVFVKGPNGKTNPALPYSVDFTTLADVPGTVISPVAFSCGKDWISLRWGPPYPPLGELEVYKVEYKLQSSERYKIKEVNINSTCKLWDGNICFTLNASDGITDSEVYDIKISAKNKGISQYGEAVPLCVRTLEKAPEAPVNLQVTEGTTNAIYLMWQHPNISNSKVRQFDINIKMISSHLRRPEQEVNMPERVLEVGQPSQNYSYELKDLQPSTEYEVSVCGVNVEPGTAAVLKAKTSLSAPDIGSQLNLGKGPATNTTLRIIIPAADRFLTKSSCFFLFVTSDKAEVDELGFRFILEPEILKKAGVEKNGHSWVAAKIQPQDEEQDFIVGNDSVTGGFWNLPLTPGRWYQVTLVAVNQQDDDFKYSIVKLPHLVQTFSEANVEADSSIGAVWAALLFLLLIPAVVYFICRKFRKPEPAEHVYEDAVPESLELNPQYMYQHVYEEIGPQSHLMGKM